MVKGVNKKIVEINDTGNIYFEKAILYVRPHMTDTPRKHLLKEAKHYLEKTYPCEQKSSGKTKKILLLISALAVIYAVTMFITAVLQK